MSRDPRHDVLFESIRIGPKVLKNRFYQVPHCTGFGNGKPWSQARFRRIKAEGGWAAVCTEEATFSAEQLFAPCFSAHMVDDGDARALSLMVEEVHAGGGLAGIELGHNGVHMRSPEARAHGEGPSQLAGMMSREVPKALERSEIRRLQQEWAAAAKRSVSIGYDIVYVYGGHATLPMQFLSPFYNRRTDEYGGSFENRARFWLDSIKMVRDVLGDQAALACRITVDDLTDETVTADESLEFIKLADPYVDLWDVMIGASDMGWDAGTSRFYPEGFLLESTGRVREVTAKPIVGVSRWTSPDRMAEVVRSGKLDIIGAARPSIADPFLPRKIEEGRLDDIRECIGANQCVSRVVEGTALGCSQNATAGEEFRRGWHPEFYTQAKNKDLDVLVVGAGPAGMEAAMVLGKRQMAHVHLVDAGPEMGGHLRWLTELPRLGTWARVINYRRIQIDKLRNVQFVPNTRLTAKDILEYGAELVVMATGAPWSPTGLNGFTRGEIPGADASLPNILTPEQVADGKRPEGQSVIVYDGEGYVTAAGVAEKLAEEGYRVQFVTPYPVVSQRSDDALDGDRMRAALHAIGVTELSNTTIHAIALPEIKAVGAYGQPIDLRADAIVLATQRVSDSTLYYELKDNPQALADNDIRGVYYVGDCVAPHHQLSEVIFDAHRLAREIDSGDPHRPLPFLREGAHDDAEALATARGLR